MMMGVFDHNIKNCSTWVSEPRCLTLFDPATGKASQVLTFNSSIDVDRAVKAARQTFDNGWNESILAERIFLLEKLNVAIKNRYEAFAQTISKEVGSPIDFSREQQVDAALNHINATLEAAYNCQNDLPVSPSLIEHRVRYEAIGVAALITPWNWPLSQVILKVAGALIAGCTIVLKPSELTSNTCMLLQECTIEAGFPDGVFNLLIGDGTTGSALVRHSGVDIISFTGSTRVGRHIAVSAAEDFKRVILELGGKSPNLIFSSCNIPKATTQGIAHCFRNAGQSCNAASRMLVERSIYEEVATLAAEIAKTTQVDMPHHTGRHIGPLISKTQFDRVQGFIAAGITEGARLIAGGLGHPEHLQQGYFTRPTVFADVTPDMAIFHEEIFGPVLTITPFDDEDHAVHLANDTIYGLAAYIQSNDADQLDRVAKRLRVGMVQANGSSRASGAAFGGIKASGMGREAGLWGIRSFQDVKSISGVPAAQRMSIQHLPSTIKPK